MMADNMLLALDTATRQLRMALQFGEDRIVKVDEPLQFSHAQVLTHKIDVLLESAGVAKRQLGGIVINSGPGSFTGLRIGMALVKGIWAALGIPIVAVSMFDLAAFKLRDEPGEIRVLAPFKRDACVMSTVRGGRWLPESMRVVDILRDAPSSASSSELVMIGVDADESSRLAKSLTTLRVVAYDAADLLTIGKERLSTVTKDAVMAMEPLYAQPSQAELNLLSRGKTG